MVAFGEFRTLVAARDGPTTGALGDGPGCLVCRWWHGGRPAQRPGPCPRRPAGVARGHSLSGACRAGGGRARGAPRLACFRGWGSGSARALGASLRRAAQRGRSRRLGARTRPPAARLARPADEPVPDGTGRVAPWRSGATMPHAAPCGWLADADPGRGGAAGHGTGGERRNVIGLVRAAGSDHQKWCGICHS